MTSVTLFVSTAQMSVNSTRPVVSLKRYPTGFCMNELAARMKYAEIIVPNAASQMVIRCSFGDRRSQPKIHNPRKVDSRKNDSSPSMARGAPKMSPTKRE